MSLNHCLENREQGGKRRNLFLADQDVRIVERRLHRLGVCDKVRRDVPPVEPHPFDDLELVLERLAVRDRDDSFLADTLHRSRDQLADLALAVCRDVSDLCNLRRGRDRLRCLFESRNNVVDSDLDPTAQVHRVHAGGDRFDSLV